MRVRVRCGIIAVSAALAMTAVTGEDWPQFRGPERDGVSAERGLLRQWPAEGPAELWRRPLGKGFSGIAVVDGRVFTLYANGGDTFAICLDAVTGQQVWRRRIGDAWRDRFGDGPRATPTADDGVVYVLSARGNLQALAAKDGSPLWSHDLEAVLGAKPPRWGVSTSPLVEGDLLLLNAGGEDGSSVVAFDKKTGRQVWRSLEDPAGYSAPVAVTIAGVRQVLFFTRKHLVSVSPQDGRTHWKTPWKTSWGVNAATPVFIAPDRVFVSSGYDVGGAVFRVVSKDDGLSVEQVWKNREMKNKFSSSVLHEDHLYGFDEKTFKCIDARNGEVRWRQRGLGHGSLFYADGHLIALGEAGRLVLVEASPEAYRERAGHEVFEGKTWTVPALSGGRLYLRDEHELVALQIAGTSEEKAAPKRSKR